MNKFIKAAFVAGSVCLATVSFASASPSIGVVNMKVLFQQSPEAKKLSKTLEDQFSGRKNDLSNLQNALQVRAQNFEKNKPTMSHAKAVAEQKAIDAQSAQLTQKSMQFRQDLYTAQNNAMDSFLNTAQGAVAAVAKSKNLDVVIPQNVVLYSSSNLDITNDVMKKLEN